MVRTGRLPAESQDIQSTRRKRVTARSLNPAPMGVLMQLNRRHFGTFYAANLVTLREELVRAGQNTP